MPSSEINARAENDRILLFVLSMSVFFVGASEFMLSAMLNPLSVAFGADTARIAWLISSYAFDYAIAAPFLGYLSDRINRSRLFNRSKHDKGVVLATAETLNNVVILTLVPVASMRLTDGQMTIAMTVFAIGLGMGSLLTLYDAVVAPTWIR